MSNEHPKWMPNELEIANARCLDYDEKVGSPHLSALIRRAALDRAIEELEALRDKPDAVALGFRSDGLPLYLCDLDARLAALRAEQRGEKG